MSGEIGRFDYDEFIRLSGMGLAKYVEPIQFNRAAIIQDGALERIAAELSAYDEFHLGFALYVGVTHRPDLFAALLAAYLDHAEISIRCAAFNGLLRLPPEQITDELIGDVKAVLAASPEARRMAEAIAGVVPELIERLEAQRNTR